MPAIGHRTSLNYLSMLKLIALSGLILLTSLASAQAVLYFQNTSAMTVQRGAEMIVQGTVELEDGSLLVNEGKMTLGYNSETGITDWLDHTITSYDHGTGTLAYNSSGVGIITSNNLFGRIEMNGGRLSLNTDINAFQWYLTNGRISTGTHKAIALGTSTSAVIPDSTNTDFDNSWFEGMLRRYVSPATENTYSFPIGNNVQSRLAMLDNLAAAPLTGVAYLDASFGDKPGTDAGLVVTENGAPYISVNDAGVWFLIPNASPTAGKFDLKLTLKGFSGLSDNSFALLQRPVASSNAAEWTVPAGSSLPAYGTAGRRASDGYTRRNSLSSFGQFGLGMADHALPVTLIDFNIKRTSAAIVQINWQTQIEENNKGFYLERRLENESSFLTIGFVASEAMDGNSTNKLDYSYTDANENTGISYYRLKQVDLDNHCAYTLIKAVKGSGTTAVSILLWPNPNNGQFSILLNGGNQKRSVYITDISGKSVQHLYINSGEAVTVHGLAAGTYIISIPDAFGEGGHFSEKVIVIH